MKTFLQFILIAAIVLAAIGLIGLLAMSGVATSHDVIRVPVPRASYLHGIVAMADYADAYSAPMVYSSYGNIDEVEKNAFRKGPIVHRTDAEVVYSGSGPGISFETGYLLDMSARPRTLTIATAVHFNNRLGRVYWTLARPVHRMLIPMMLDRMAQAAPKH